MRSERLALLVPGKAGDRDMRDKDNRLLDAAHPLRAVAAVLRMARSAGRDEELEQHVATL
jgi:hypothetical protein